jgi:hypothetical protein
MGKASSAKKVARVAGLGGSRAYGSRPPWGFYIGILVLVLLGVAGVYNSREFRDNQINKQGNSQPAVHRTPPWFEGFGVEACGKLLPDIKTTKDPYGITIKSGNVIWVSPTVKAAAGSNATLGKFASSIGMTLNASEIETPGGRLYQTGDSCEGKPGRVYVMTWSSPQALPSDGTLQSKKDTKAPYEDTCNPDCDSGVLLKNDQLVTVAFLPAPAKGKTLSVLQPPQSVISRLTNLVATGGTTTTTAAPPTTTTTVKGATTTVKGATTTVKGATTNTTSKSGSSTSTPNGSTTRSTPTGSTTTSTPTGSTTTSTPTGSTTTSTATKTT